MPAPDQKPEVYDVLPSAFAASPSSAGLFSMEASSLGFSSDVAQASSGLLSLALVAAVEL